MPVWIVGMVSVCTHTSILSKLYVSHMYSSLCSNYASLKLFKKEIKVMYRMFQKKFKEEVATTSSFLPISNEGVKPGAVVAIL